MDERYEERKCITEILYGCVPLQSGGFLHRKFIWLDIMGAFHLLYHWGRDRFALFRIFQKERVLLLL